MKTEPNKSRSLIGSPSHRWQKQEKFNKECVARVRQLYVHMGQAQQAVQTTNDRLIQLAGYSKTSRKVIEAASKQSQVEIAKVKAELDAITQQLDALHRELDTINGGPGRLSFSMQSYLVYAAILFSTISMGLALWVLIGA